MIKCVYQTNIIQIKHNKLRIPTGGSLTSWLFTRRGGVESGPPKTNPARGREEDLNPGPPDYKSPSAGPRSPLRSPPHRATPSACAKSTIHLCGIY